MTATAPASTPPTDRSLLHLAGIVGRAGDQDMADRLHDLGHAGTVEYIVIEERDAQRRRLRISTDKGTDCAIVLPRDQRLQDGDVLLIDDRRAIVVRLGEQRWLPLRPRDAAVGLRLGYHAGNLHWRVRFDGTTLLVALEGDRQAYIDRLTEFLEAGELEVLD